MKKTSDILNNLPNDLLNIVLDYASDRVNYDNLIKEFEVNLLHYMSNYTSIKAPYESHLKYQYNNLFDSKSDHTYRYHKSYNYNIPPEKNNNYEFKYPMYVYVDNKNCKYHTVDDVSISRSADSRIGKTPLLKFPLLSHINKKTIAKIELMKTNGYNKQNLKTFTMFTYGVLIDYCIEKTVNHLTLFLLMLRDLKKFKKSYTIIFLDH